MPRKPQTKPKNSGQRTVKFSVDCSAPVDDGIMDPNAFEKYLHDRIKVKGKAGNLGDSVKVSKDKAVFSVESKVPMSKRYLKYLTKKFLKKQQLKDYFHIVSTSKSSYTVKYYNINQAGDEEGAADE